MVRKRRPKSVRNARNTLIASQEKSYTKTPHTMIFSRPGVGSLVKQLSLDVREIFEPFTASCLRVTRQNVLKDFITIAGPLNVTHLLYFTHPRKEEYEKKRARRLAKTSLKQLNNNNNNNNDTIEQNTIVNKNNCNHSGGVYLHMIRVPHGPSLTFRVVEYSLKRDIQTLIRRVFDSRQYSSPPLLVMTGFGMGGGNTSAPLPHLRLVVDMFQNLLPPLNVPKLKLSTVKRVLLVSRDVDTSCTDCGDETKQMNDVIYIRHFHIRTENRCISRALRRLGVGGAKMKRRCTDNSNMKCGIGPSGSGKSTGVPNLAKYASMDDFLTKTGLLSDSALSDILSDMEEVDLLPDVNLSSVADTDILQSSSRKRKRDRDAGPIHGLKHLGTAKKATIRLTEIGPRITLNLIKIEEGVNTGTVLYHRWQTRSLTELAVQSERLRQREIIRAKRRAEHEARRIANEAEREAHRIACLEGMKRAGQLPLPSNEIIDDNTAIKNKATDTKTVKFQLDEITDKKMNKKKKLSINQKSIVEPTKSVVKKAFKSNFIVRKKRK
ncbi:Suppressor of SWI4 1 isoform 2 [Schistosoma japonicum]|uniref:Suppressor of SWI4 1 isoform 2 n=1 Tax=Schistosoma japonicum TaxID=6182 RepID=A0A4Z2DXL5_SCHJA|nr:Suppressor of SWI4 1 isoform 2 [Schistosoma japonicum]